MTIKSNERGHDIYYNPKTKKWCYCDNNKIANNKRECKRCGQKPINGKDYCLKKLYNNINITSACCGHGVVEKIKLLQS